MAFGAGAGGQPVGNRPPQAPPLPPASRAEPSLRSKEEDWALSNLLKQRPLPKFAENSKDERWRVERCFDKFQCQNLDCNFYHMECEKRCKEFSETGTCKDGDNCKDLHVLPDKITQTLTIDLESPADAVARLRAMEKKSRNDLACYARIVVYGFAGLREELLKKFLKLFPFLHEIVLPDRTREPNLLVYLCDIVEALQMIHCCPNLRKVCFEDGGSEQLC